MTKPPCINCTERHLACHDRCEKYKGWQAENDKIKAIKQKDIHEIGVSKELTANRCSSRKKHGNNGKYRKK